MPVITARQWPVRPLASIDNVGSHYSPSMAGEATGLH